MLLSLLLGILCASAQEDSAYAKAKQAYQYGKQLFEEGDYLGAIQAFERSYSITQKYELLFNIGLAYQFSGELEQAREKFLEYQKQAPASQKDEAQTRIDNIDIRLQKKKEREQEQEQEQEAKLKEKEEEEEESLPEQRMPPQKLAIPKPALYSLWGVGAIGIGSGVFFGAQSLDSQTQINSHCVDGICSRAAQAPMGEQKNQALYADIGWGIGIAAAGTALWFTMASSNSTSLSLSPTHLSIFGEF